MMPMRTRILASLALMAAPRSLNLRPVPRWMRRGLPTQPSRWQMRSQAGVPLRGRGRPRVVSPADWQGPLRTQVSDGTPGGSTRGRRGGSRSGVRRDVRVLNAPARERGAWPR